MKINNIVSIVVFASYTGCFAQTTRQEVTLMKIDGEYKILYRGRHFKANKEVLTVKPVSDSLKNKSFTIIRKNLLGYYDRDCSSNCVKFRT